MTTNRHGRPKKSWSVCVKVDVNVCNLEGIDPKTEKHGDLV